MKSKTLGFVLGWVGVFFLIFIAQAQEIISIEESQKLEEQIISELGSDVDFENAILIATVNVYEAEILKQENNEFELSFLVTNGEKAQPGIKYAIQLTSINDAGQEVLVDEKVYSEVLDLGANSEIKKTIEYGAPSYLNGKYSLNIISKTEEGVVLGTNYFGEVSLSGDNEYVEVLTETCFLTVDGEESSKKYELLQGVDVLPEEILKLNCEVQNHSSQDVVLNYITNSFYRSSFNEKVDSSDNYKEVINIKAGEKQNISIEIEKEEQPQAYDAVISFKTDNNIPVNKVMAHYVLSGKSASIVNLLLDKNFYDKGDQARISFFYAGPANNFPDSRLGVTPMPEMIAKFRIKDSEGNFCGQETSHELDESEINLSVSYAIDKTCSSPIVKAVLIDKETGEVLANNSFSFSSSKQMLDGTSEISEIRDNEKRNRAMIIILIGIIALIISLIFLIKNKKGKFLGFFLALLFSSFCFLNEARADSIVIPYAVSDGGQLWVDHTLTFNYSLNKSVYIPGETVSATAWISNFVCSNSISAGQVGIQTSFSSPGGSTVNPYSQRYTYGLGVNRLSATAPSTAGTYYTRFSYVDLRYNEYVPSVFIGVPVAVRWKNFNVICADTSWSPAVSTVCSGTTFTQTSNCGTTQTATGTKCCDTSWTPATSTVCSGTTFTQTSNCGTTQTATGTKCCDTSWTPAVSEYCSGTTFTQTGTLCGTTQTATGTKTCSGDYCNTSAEAYSYCSNNDVYGTYNYWDSDICSGTSCLGDWIYNSCGTYKQQECGSDSCDTSGTEYEYCQDGDVWSRYSGIDRGCASASCYSNPVYCNQQLKESCGVGYACNVTGTNQAECAAKSAAWTEN